MTTCSITGFKIFINENLPRLFPFSLTFHTKFLDDDIKSIVLSGGKK